MTGKSLKAGFIVVFVLCLFAGWRTSHAITANPLISRGKPAYGQPTNASLLVNGFFGSGWYVSDGSWAAIKVGAGPSRVFFSWNNPNYTWSDIIASATSCKQTPAFPVNYEILTSANSTNGSDGQWTTAVTVTHNTVTARGHLVDFTGMSWVKIHITNGGGQIDEAEVFDVSGSSADTWFFPGTSISCNAFKGSPPGQNFAALVAAAHPGYNPAMIRGGIPCIGSNQLAGDISKYLQNAGNVHYWAIEMGTNDVWGGNTDATNYKTNMQAVITACKNAGITPIVARILATNAAKAGWQVSPAFLTAVDDLARTNGLPAGPDLYSYFLAHPAELNDDGVHPNATGAASIQRLWADAASALYSRTAVARRYQVDGHMQAAGKEFGILLPGSVSSGTPVYTLAGVLRPSVASIRTGSGMCVFRITGTGAEYIRDR